MDRPRKSDRHTLAQQKKFRSDFDKERIRLESICRMERTFDDSVKALEGEDLIMAAYVLKRLFGVSDKKILEQLGWL